MSGSTPTLKSELERVDNVQVLIDEDLSKLSTLKLKATGDLILIRSLIISILNEYPSDDMSRIYSGPVS